MAERDINNEALATFRKSLDNPDWFKNAYAFVIDGKVLVLGAEQALNSYRFLYSPERSILIAPITKNKKK